ncbi:MAG: hypothetical protein KKB50_19715 [Planctomycetes bacterium]|nr:hypothetical protein [Planctomycetota bacterium]
MSATPATDARPRSGVEPAASGRADLVVLLITLVGAALAIWMALQSDGVHHDDDLVHLQYARWSWECPQYLLHEWGRPGFTVLYALPARCGWPVVRIFTVLLTALTGWLTYCIGRRQGLSLAVFAPALLWLQPMTFTLSYTTLTEPVLAFYLTLAMWLHLRGDHARSAAVISLCWVTRHEGALFVALWLVVMWHARRPLRQWLWLAWAPLLHNLLCVIFLDKLPLLALLEPNPTDQYGSGGWFHMLAHWGLLTAGVGPLALALVGALRAGRRPGGLLWVGCGATFFLAHTVIFRFGLFAGGGYYRFLVSIGPVVAVLAADALSQAWDAGVAAVRREGNREWPRGVRRMLLASACAVGLLWVSAEAGAAEWLAWAVHWIRRGAPVLLAVCLLCYALCAVRNVAVRCCTVAACPALLLWVALQQPLWARGIQPPFRQCAPLRLAKEQLLARAAVEWVQAEGLGDRRIVSANPWVFEFLGRAQSPFRPSTRMALATLRSGDLFVWDAGYAPSAAHGVALASLQGDPSLAELWHGDAHGRYGIYCHVFEKLSGPTTAPNHRQEP